MTDIITARFAVTGWNPRELDGLGDWIGAITMLKSYTSGLVGSSEALFVSSGDEESGRGYLAVERITARADDGREGAFTVHHGALQHPSDPTAFAYIVPGTGTGGFAGIVGTASIEHDGDGPMFRFTLA